MYNHIYATEVDTRNGAELIVVAMFYGRRIGQR